MIEHLCHESAEVLLYIENHKCATIAVHLIVYQ